ncbi:uncharacterized protein VTP21DRAFT_6449 [Calcarisporiella thermophila]|uniref:uncharacterized protein n=1 Tax=Calcarisporiella thermophila TaxID=911321 RepID=UPI003743E380
MDLVLELCDGFFLDSLYSRLFASEFMSSLAPSLAQAMLSRDFLLRQFLSLMLLVTVSAYLIYFLFAGLSYRYFFNHELMRHPKFLKGQLQMEIAMSVRSLPYLSLFTCLTFLVEVRGYSLLYSNVDEFGLPYLIFSIFAFLLFTDFGIYWIHRGLHHPLIYRRIHKPHHRWLVPTPFASHAFHPLDGYAQSLPYHVFVFLFPMQRIVYLGLFVFVNLWTILIHDGEYFTNTPFINSAAHHTLHHLYFNYNYGQYFVLWDWVGQTHRAPEKESPDSSLAKLWTKQVKEMESLPEYDPNDVFLEKSRTEIASIAAKKSQ